MSAMLVALMLRSGIPYDAWLRQPEGVIETALQLLNDDGNDDDAPKTVYSG